MADQVNRLMEAMIPELDDYRRRNLFTPQEIAAIVTQRRTYEYKLARRIAQQSDYLTYITYELNLNQLRRKRKAKLHTAASTVSTGASVSDHAGLSRICFLFERCLRHFHSSSQLWLHYLHFLTASQSHKRLGLTLPRAHLLLPHSSELWLAHAQHCFTTTADMAALRSVMQRALRLMKGRVGEERVWLGWFGYEVGFIAKVMERKRVLGLNVRDDNRGDIDIRYKAGRAAEEGKEANEAREEERKKGLDELVLTAVLPKLIYTNATSTPSTSTPSDRQYLLSRKKRKRGLPPPPPAANTKQLRSSLEFRLSFLSLVPDARNGRFDARGLPSSDIRRLVHAMAANERAVYVKRVEWSGLLQQMYEGLERDFQDKADVLPLLAEWKRQQKAGEESEEAGEARGWKVYEAATERAVRGVWTAYLQYLQQRVDVQVLQRKATRALTQHLETVTRRLVEMAELPAEDGLGLLLSELLVRMGSKEQAARVLTSIDKRQRTASTWQQLAHLTDNDDGRAAVLQEAIRALPKDERHIPLLERLNELVCVAGDEDSQQLALEAFQTAFHVSNHSSLVAAFLDYLSLRLLSSSPLSPARVRTLLTALPLMAQSSLLVLAWCEQHGVAETVLLRRLWEGVVSERGNDVGVWRCWIAWERASGDETAANRLRWRAEKALGSGADLRLLEAS